jgi:hypothetical protein
LLEVSRVTPLSERLSERQLPGPPAFRGQILIVGFVTNWSAPKPSELARLRAELHCLSSSLVLLGPDQVLRVQSDDTLRAGQPQAACDRQEFDALLAPLSRPGHVAKRELLRLALVNPSGAIAWSHDGEAPRHPIALLIAALSQARRHLLAGPGRLYGITRAELVGSLTSAFTSTFGSNHPLGALARTEASNEIRDRASGERV